MNTIPENRLQENTDFFNIIPALSHPYHTHSPTPISPSKSHLLPMSAYIFDQLYAPLSLAAHLFDQLYASLTCAVHLFDQLYAPLICAAHLFCTLFGE